MALLAAVPEPSAVQYGDVFSDNVAVQEGAVTRFALLLEAREQIQDRQASDFLHARCI